MGIRIDGCPLKMLTAPVVEAFQAADMAREGIMPVAGGWLNQTQSFLDCMRECWRLDAVFSRGSQ